LNTALRIIEAISFITPIILCGAVGAAIFSMLREIYNTAHSLDKPKKKKDE
jgi:hypothetical protein